MTSFKQRLKNIANRARQQRLSGSHYNENEDFPLIGFCFDNAFVLMSMLETEHIEAHVIEGTTERVADSLISNGLDPRTFDSVTDLAGHVHYWVEAIGPNTDTYYIDIASDSFERLGDVVVTRTLPEDYIQLADSRTAGTETYETVKSEGVRCPQCGDHKYTHGGCPMCQDLISDDLVEN